MAVTFHPLKLKEVKKETSECVVLTFDVPENLSDLFQYKEGQNITIRCHLDGEELRRSYSICAAPYEKRISVAVKEIPGGKFSSYANQALKAGDVLEVLSPVGNFHAKQMKEDGHYVAIAAGSGITPIISIIKHTLKHYPNTSFTLVYGNKQRHSIIFFEELEALKNQYLSRFNLIHILSREHTDIDLHHGRINAEKLEALQPVIGNTLPEGVFICGPQEMIFDVKSFYENKGLATDKIHFELFNTPTSSGTNVKKEAVADDAPKSKVTIRLDGRVFDIQLGYNDKSILDAALQTGADLPYACKGGVCCSCRAKVTEGTVEMDVNYALEQDELDQGFVLTCQAHPTSPHVMIDFDVR